ncbi:MAG: arsenic efflux protein [Clostridia bacterium]|nr:arsenic efflux protein [Clostridia bacterium]
MHEIWHHVQHAFSHSVGTVPFLFLAYFVIEYIEKRSSDKMQRTMTRLGRFGPFGGAVLGCVPQCGFSASAANFYSNRVVTLGTLVAVFISTSDEAIPMLLSNSAHAGTVLKLLGAKVVIGALAGFVVDMLFKTSSAAHDEIHHKHGHCCKDEEGFGSMLFAAAKHTLSTYAFIFIVSFILCAAVEKFGSERVGALFMSDTVFQPFIAALIGFIPNCASSVLLTQLYIEGTLSFGSAVAGLCTGAGVGLAVLFKENRPMKDNFKIMAILYAVSVIAGLLL